MDCPNPKKFKARNNVKTVKLRGRAHQSGAVVCGKERIILGFHSMNSQYEFTDDLSQLRYLRLPPDRYVEFNLNVNSSTAIKRRVPTNEVRLDALLKWIMAHQPNTMESPRRVKEIVCLRGLLSKVMCTPYEKMEGWIICATKFQGRIYLCKYITPEAVLAEQSRTLREKQMCDWGYVFEQYTVSEDPDSPPDMSKPTNQNEEFMHVFQTNLGHHRLLLAAEMDALKLDNTRGKVPAVGNDASKLKELLETGRAKFVELKTSLDPSNSDFEWRKICRFKSLRWWTQCVIAGVDEVVCGYRTNDGVVKKLETFQVNRLPELGRRSWDPNVCLNFAVEFLDIVAEQVLSSDDEVLWKFTWAPEQRSDVTVEQCDETSPYFFLHKWFTSAQTSEGSVKNDTSQVSGEVSA